MFSQLVTFLNAVMDRDQYLVTKKVDRGIFVGYGAENIHS
jgi:hypothetical protein